MKKSFHQHNLERWESALKSLFPFELPTYCLWEQPESIIKVLQTVSSAENLSHLYLPAGGGMHFRGVSASVEPSCIELHTDATTYIVRPAFLSFEFVRRVQFAYFWLEAGSLKPRDLSSEEENPISEELTALAPGRYAPLDFWNEGNMGTDERGLPIALPSEATPVRRYFRGSFLLFAESSKYGFGTDPYDARHMRMTRKQFRAYMERKVRS